MNIRNIKDLYINKLSTLAIYNESSMILDMETLTHKQICSNGGKKAWKGTTKAERSKIIKDRWLIRRLKKEVKEAVK